MKLNPKVYIRAAETVSERKDLPALLAIYDGSRESYTHALQLMTWLYPLEFENDDHRLTALCLMAAIVEAGDV